MANYYVQLPAQNANAMANFSGITDALDSNRLLAERNRQADERQEERTYQRGRNAMMDARYDDQLKYSRGRDAIADSRYADETLYNRGRLNAADEREAQRFAGEMEDAESARATKKKAAMAGFIQQHISNDQDPASRATKWQKFLSINPDAASLPQAYHDPVYGPDLVLSEAGVSAAGNKDFATRARAAAQYGLEPGSDAYLQYVLTGKMPREDQQSLTATDKKAILEADEMVAVNRGAITALTEAEKLSPQANQGWFAGARASLGNNLPDMLVPDFISSPQSSEATANLDNAVVGNALSQLKAIFGAAPTEGERKILLDLQGSANQPHNVRMEIYARARAAAERRLAFNEDRATQLRGGTFYKPQGSALKPPQVGSVVDGYRFKGGDPGDKNNWEAQ